MGIMTATGWADHRRGHKPSWEPLPPNADAFGFVDREDVTVHLPWATIRPAPDLALAREWIAAHTDREERLVHPPEQTRVDLDPFGEHVVRYHDQTRRPAALHHLPASHILELTGPIDARAERQRRSMFLMHLFGYVTGGWLQFHDLWFVGSVPVGRGPFDAHPTVIQQFMEKATATWEARCEKAQKRITGLLYMYCRVPGYRTLWERFAWEYSVLDTIINVSGIPPCKKAASLKGKRRDGHRQRIEDMCSHYGVLYDDATVRRIVKLRNDLIHELSWDGGGAPTGGGSNPALYAASEVHNLNARLIAAMLGYRNSYVGTQWWDTFTRFPFESV